MSVLYCGMRCMRKEKAHIVRNPLEAKVRGTVRRGAIRNALMSVLVIGGLMPVALAAPKVLALLKREHLDSILPQDPRQRLHETASRLKQRGWITFEIRNGRKQMRVTESGMREMARIRLGTYAISQPRTWDGKWRIVMFDINERRRVDRAKIRHILSDLGLYRLQDSVWVHPFDCEEVIALIKTEFRLGENLLYVIADAIDYDRRLRDHFDLPLT